MPPVFRRILGVDPGTARVGWGLLEYSDKGTVAIAYGCIETPKDDAPHMRLQQIHREFNDLLNEYKPTEVVVERLFFTKNQKTAMAVSEAKGVILLSLADQNIPYCEKAPREVKMAMTGNGTAEKKQVQYMVTQILDLDKIPQPDDAADGLALALSVLN